MMTELARRCMQNEIERIRAANGVVELDDEQKCARYRKRMELTRARVRRWHERKREAKRLEHTKSISSRG